MSEQMDIQVQEEDCAPLPAPLKTRVQLAGSALAVGGVVDLFAHGGLPGFAMAGLAAYIAWRHSGDLSESVRKRYSLLDPKTQASLAGFTNWARGNSAYMEGMPEIETEVLSTTTSEDITRARQAQATSCGPDDYESWYREEDDSLPSTIRDAGMFTFSEVLDKGFKPSLNKIFVGRLVDGTDVFVEVKDLCHVALAGLTGNGKGTIMRLIMSQLCSIGVRVLLLNPHYMGYDHSGGEDWTPFEGNNAQGDPYLQKPPIPCSKFETIAFYLEWMAKTLLSQRIEKAQQGEPLGRPYFVVVDELPAIVAEVPEVTDYLAKLLREGRKFGIYVVVASQDFQVKTIGLDGGGVRKCFKTAFYVGGDSATAKALLNKSVADIPENDLGKGVIMLRCIATKDAVLARVPFVDNESLYRLLGPSTYRPRQRVIDPDYDRLIDPGQQVLPQVQEPELTIEQIMTMVAQMKDVDPNDLRYTPVVAPVPPTPQLSVVEEKDQVKIEWALQLWEKGHSSVRKLEAISGWSNGETRRIIKLMKDQGLITDEN